MPIGINGIEPKFGRTTTALVAAYDAPLTTKLQADFVCDGTADNAEIQSAIGSGNRKIMLSSGHFNLSSAIDIGFENLDISGMGIDVTTIKPVGGIDAFSNTATSVYSISVSALTIDGENQTGNTKSGIYGNRIGLNCRNIKVYRASGTGLKFDCASSVLYKLDIDNIKLDSLAGNDGISVENTGFVSIKNIDIKNHTGGTGVIRVVGGSSQYASPGNVLISNVSAYNVSGPNAVVFVCCPRENKVTVQNVDVYLAACMGIQVLGGTSKANAPWVDVDLINFSGRYVREAGISLDYIRGVRVTDCSKIGHYGTSSEGANEGEGLDIVNSSDIVVTGGNYSHNDGAGITVWNSDNIVINRAMIMNNGANLTGDSSESGIRVRYWDGTCSNIHTIGCIVIDNQATATNSLTGNANSGQKAIPVTDGTLFFRFQRVQLVEGATNEYAEVDYVYNNTVYVRSNLTNSYTSSATLQGIATQRTGIIELSYGTGSISGHVIDGNMLSGNYEAQITTIESSTVVRNNSGAGTEDQSILNSIITARGDMIYGSAANTPATLSPGTAGHVLTSGGAGADPSWANMSDVYVRLDGSNAMTGNLNMNGNQVVDMALHSVANDTEKSAITPKKGKMLYQTDTNAVYICTATE